MLSTALVALTRRSCRPRSRRSCATSAASRLFPWLFSVYLLAQTATVPVYGKLADQFGRKPLMYYGIGMFLLGSILCGLAWSMPALIVARALQGLGAGAVQPIGMTIIGDVYSLRERAKIQGYVASVWGISSVIGPTLGGVFSQSARWRFIFWVNIPLCLLAAWMLRRFAEKVERGHVKVDYVGAALLTLGHQPRGPGPAGGRPLVGVGLLADVAIFGTAVLLLGRVRAPRAVVQQPILPLWVFASGTLRIDAARLARWSAG